ncbi:putative membrane protein [Aliarcobacter faecis]|uniref:hypothetical protein n=1 Tax=Aliarcobacter faecis TaxID=1564138 RepID=UPI000687B39A|nr:hypothetical protein [Aliarcobacter faecis]QKF72776.1 putative membrane protein [Aliarcobacter faecis]
MLSNNKIRIIVYSIAILLILSGLMSISTEIIKSVYLTHRSIVEENIFLGILFIIFGAMIFGYYYLVNNSEKLKEKSPIEKYKNEINLFEEKIKVLKNLNFSTSINEKEELEKTLKLYSLQQSLINVKIRLEDEVSNLRRRAIVNLLIGGGITLVGLSILGLSVLSISDANNLSKEINSIFLYYTPRVLLVLFMQIFAYFFLRLYKFTLDEIKHFQNELTNIESKLAAIEIAHATGNDEAMKDIISDLLQTERNFILKKGESTIELKREKMESDNIKNVLKEISSYLKDKS